MINLVAAQEYNSAMSSLRIVYDSGLLADTESPQGAQGSSEPLHLQPLLDGQQVRACSRIPGGIVWGVFAGIFFL